MESRRSIVLWLSLALIGLTATVLAGVLAVQQIRSRNADSKYKPSIALHYDVDYVLDDDGGLEVVENIEYELRSRGGVIVRNYGGGMPADMVPVDFAVTRDGKPESMSWERVPGGGHRLVVGDVSLGLIGVHRYRLSYRIPDALSHDRAEFVYPLISTGYAVQVEHARLTLKLPVSTTLVQCVVGVSKPCDVTGEGSTNLVIEAGPMPPNSGVTLRALLAQPLSG